MENIVIIGGGASGMMFSTQYKRKNKDNKVTVFEKSSYVAWAGCPTPYYISGELDFNAVVGHLVSSFEKKEIEVNTNTEIIKIDTNNKYVLTDKNKKVPYDKLIIAVGAKPKFKLANAYTLSNPNDAINISNRIKDMAGKKALIIGAGFIGIELAESMIKKGLDVTIVESKDEFFENISFSTKDIFYNKLNETNLKYYLSKKVSEFNENYVLLDDGTRVDFDLIILATGVTPNIDFLNGKIETKDNKICVDEYFNTSVKDVYAIGDCVYNKNIIDGRNIYQAQGDVANKHGYLLAANLSGEKRAFLGTNLSFATSYFDIKIAGTGYSLKQALDLGYSAKLVTMTAGVKNSHFHDAKENKVEVVIDEKTNLILGAFSVGYFAVAQFIDQFSILISQKVKIDNLINIDFCYSPTNATVWNPILVLYRKVVK